MLFQTVAMMIPDYALIACISSMFQTVAMMVPDYALIACISRCWTVAMMFLTKLSLHVYLGAVPDCGYDDS